MSDPKGTRQHNPYFEGREGIAFEIKYPNGYGASIICRPGSYGYEKALFEVAVLKGDELCYDTHITGDVVGWLDFAGVSETLHKIANLPMVE